MKTVNEEAFVAVGRQKISGLQGSAVSDVKYQTFRRTSSLPFLVKRKLNTSARRLSKESEDVCRHRCNRNLLRLPHIPKISKGRSEERLRGQRVNVQRKHKALYNIAASPKPPPSCPLPSPLPSLPPPPPNSVELRSLFSK